MSALPFRRFGPAVSRTPVVIAVPHAGRLYPPALARLARLPVERLVALEDRHADALVGQALAAGATAIVATVARAWIDLSRDPREVDPAMIAPRPVPPRDSFRIRAGLGLIPRRVGGDGEIWTGPIAAADLAERIATVHAPYHAAVAAALAAARDRHGHAILLDCHSMPALAGGDRGIGIVFGDLAGVSAAASVTAVALAAARRGGFRASRNRPYAGGYTVARHGRPDAQIHALQVEVCRTLYLDAMLREPGPGLPRLQDFIAALHAALGGALSEALIAAE